MASKILITGLPNSGKSHLCKDLKDTLVLARDGKKYPFPIPHKNLNDFIKIQEVIEESKKVIHSYNTKFGDYPKIVVIDAVSRIFAEIVSSCQQRFQNFEIWNNVDLEINKFLHFINEIVDNDITVVLIAHAVWDAEGGKYTETSSGKFGKIGGFLSTVDYSMYTSVSTTGGKRTIHHKNMPLARCLLDGIPDKEPTDKFSLQDYITKIETKNTETNNFELLD